MSFLRNVICGAPKADVEMGAKKPVEVFDYIIVGCGAAGSALANRLVTLSNYSVLIVECGPPYNNGDTATTDLNKFVYAYDTSRSGNIISKKEPYVWNKTFEHNYGRTLGGGTVVNTCVYFRGSKQDFDDWKCPGWEWDNVLPYFKDMEAHPMAETNPKRHGATGLLGVSTVVEHLVGAQFVRAAQDEGFEFRDDVNGHDNQDHSVSFNQFNVKTEHGVPVKRNDAFTAFVRPVMRKQNISIYSNTFVKRVIFEGDLAVGVEVEVVTYSGNKMVRTGECKTYRANREVVLSGGALLSPKILMLSGVGPIEHLAKKGIECVANVPGVGENLQDHAGVGVIFETREEMPDPLVVQPATLWHRSDQVYDDYAVHMIDGIAISNAAPWIKEAVRNMSFVTKFLKFPQRVFMRPRATMIMGCSLMKPQSKGYVRLKSADPFEKPEICFNYFQDPRDLDTLVQACKTARKVGSHPSLSTWIKKEAYPAHHVKTDEDWKHHILSSMMQGWHYGSSCKMGVDSDPMAVVDPECRVRGVRGLRVIDGSVMSDVVGVNTNATCMMIGWKMGYMMLGKKCQEHTDLRAAAHTGRSRVNSLSGYDAQNEMSSVPSSSGAR